MYRNLLIVLFIFGLSTTTMAESFLKDVKLYARLGYNLGGTAPIGLPSTIRGMDSYKLCSNSVIETDAMKNLDDRWGGLVGIRLENKDMDVNARVKNYHMEIVRGGQSLEGMFTGNVHTLVRQWMITLPIQATYSINDKLRLRMGPYVSYLLSKDFEGEAYNGHLRVGNPTGPLVEMGNDVGTRGTCDFSEHMRRIQVGVSAGIDWNVYRRFDLFADVNWGLTGIHHSNFKTIEQALYPIFGTFGVNYRISKK